MAPVPTPYKHGATAPGCRSCATAPAGGLVLCALFQCSGGPLGAGSGPDQGGGGQGPEQATPDALGIEQAGPKKLGKVPGRRTGRTKSPGITLSRQPKSCGNTLLIVMVSGVFLCPLTPKYHDPKGYFFPLSNYSFGGSFRVVSRKSYVVFHPKLTPKT